MKKLIYFLSILLFINCDKKVDSTYKEMKADKLLSESFTDNELQNLAKIVDFFESEIIINQNLSKTENYKVFTNKSANYVLQNDTFKLKIDYKNQQKLYGSLDSSFFKEIWVFYAQKKWKVGNLHFEEEAQYNINIVGKFFKYLKDLSKHDSIVNDFHKNASISNDINFPAGAQFLAQIQKEEFQSINRKLFFAFYFLSANEHNQHKLKVTKL